jgi:hypothetical protein
MFSKQASALICRLVWPLLGAVLSLQWDYNSSTSPANLASRYMFHLVQRTIAH